MKNISYFLIVVLIFLSLWATNHACSQSLKDSLSYRSITRLNISLQANSYNDLNISNTAGEELLNSGQTLTPELGVSLSQNIWKNWVISFGGAATVIPFNINFNFDLKTHSPYFDESSYTHFYDYWYFIVDYMLKFGVFRTIYRKDDYSFNIESGMKLNRIWPYKITSWLSVVNNADENKRIFDFLLKTPTSDWMTKYSYYGKFGFLKHTHRNLNHWTLSLVYQYSPAIIGKGHYEFSNLNEPTEGEVELGLNYLGIEFLYAFNLFKKTDLSPDKGFSRTEHELNMVKNPEFKSNAADFDTLPVKSLYLKGGVALNGFSKLDIEPTNEDNINSKHAYSPSFSVDLAYTLKNNWILNSGFEYKKWPINMSVDFVSVTSRDNVISVPVSVQKLCYQKKLWFWNVYGGLTYNRFQDRNEVLLTDDSSHFSDEQDEWKNCFGIFLKAGMFRKMKNEQFMEINLVSHYSPFDVKDVAYKTNSKQGEFSLGINYLGLELLYGFRIGNFQ